MAEVLTSEAARAVVASRRRSEGAISAVAKTPRTSDPAWFVVPMGLITKLLDSSHFDDDFLKRAFEDSTVSSYLLRYFIGMKAYGKCIVVPPVSQILLPSTPTCLVIKPSLVTRFFVAAA